ncbi:unnamed protein product [Bemisia tabaci]|uniref:Amino acid transporter n=1 Tax=Bemisia tabaci TaxID=7038 RepID=A0A9P0A2K9_BEMTA|nr:PREDICTED: excitatory amino acid transporter-like [Bemisia tabaci]CAH0382128.1 unnamed protein product [Bemisia tabaci]
MPESSREEKTPQENTRPLIKIVEHLRKNGLLVGTFLGVIAGGALGFILRSLELTPDTIVMISYPGELFLRALKLLILPFVISCIIIGTASLNIHKNGKIAVRTIVYFFATTTLNVLLGLVAASIMHPGGSAIKVGEDRSPGLQAQTSIHDGFLDMGRNILPDNIFLAALETTYTKYELIPGTNGTYKKTIDTRPGTNMIGVVMFCVMFGSVLGTIGSERELVINFFSAVYKVLMKLLLGVIWFTPLGVGSVICGKIASVPDIGSTVDRLAWFILTTLVALAIYHVIIIQLIYFFFIRKNPFKYYSYLGPSLLTACVAASKSAALPVTFKILEEEVKMDKRVTRFILPLGNLNMNGTGVYMAVGIMFIAQMNSIALEIDDLVNLWVTVTFLAMSLSTVPSACLVHVVALCNLIRAPVEDVSLLFAVEFILDRARTINNILGDCYSVAVIQKLSEKELAAFDQEELQDSPALPLKTVQTCC